VTSYPCRRPGRHPHAESPESPGRSILERTREVVSSGPFNLEVCYQNGCRITSLFFDLFGIPSWQCHFSLYSVLQLQHPEPS
jgi:hypothetical protein